MNYASRAISTFRLHLALWMVAGGVCGVSPAAHAEEAFFKMNGQGELLQPVGYREWISVGTPVTPNDMNKGKAPFPEFHAVYIDPASWAHWKNTGAFREGTILVKELISVSTKEAASGNGYFMGEFIGLEATVKSTKLFPKEPGNWGYFSFTNHGQKSFKPSASLQPVDKCNDCHDSHAEKDWVFIQYYPVLRSATGK